MNSYEARIEARKERMEARAERLRKEGQASIDRAHKMAEIIPFGQPILVGHHSEKGDRAYRARIHNGFDKGFRTLKAADEAAARADSVGTGGISSDDPDAVTKLRAELVDLEAKQQRMGEANKLLRKGDVEGLKAMGFGASLIAAWQVPGWGGKCRAFEPYQLSNNSANIRRIKERVAQLEANATREAKETLHNSGVRIVENVEANRLQLFFPDKPAEAVRSNLKSYGFRWAPSEGAWQRQLSNGARYAAECVTRALPTCDA